MRTTRTKEEAEKLPCSPFHPHLDFWGAVQVQWAKTFLGV